MPADVIGMAWTSSFDALFDTVKAKATKYGVPLPLSKALVLEKVKSEAGFKSMDWFDTGRSLKVIAWNPKKFDNGVILVPITGQDKTEAALPEVAKKGVEGNAYELDIDGEKAYVNFIEGYAVVTGDAGMFEAAKDVATRAAKEYTGTGIFQVQVAAANLRSLYPTELAELRKELEGIKPMLNDELKSGMPIPGMDGLDGIIDWYVGMINTAIDETDIVSMAMELDDLGGASLTTTVTGVASGKMAAFANKFASADLSYADNAPKNAYIVFGSDIDPKAFDGLMDYASDIVGELFKLDDGEKKKFNDLMVQMTTLQTGKSWVAIYADGKFPLAMASGSGTSDGAAYQKAANEYMGLMMGKLMAMGKEFLPAELQSLPTDDFAKLVQSLNGLTGTVGVKLDAGETKDGDVTVQKLTIDLNIEQIGKLAGPAETAQIKAVTDLLGTSLQFAIAYGPKHMAFAMGPNGVKHATDIARGTSTGATYSKRFAKGTAVFAHVDVTAAINAWMPIIKMAGVADKIPAFEPGTDIGFTMGSATNSLNFRLYGSLDKWVTLGMKAFMTMGGGDREPRAAPAQEEPAPVPAPAPAPAP